jgi:uncharacterized protein YbbC (DUF1343 family)
MSRFTCCNIRSYRRGTLLFGAIVASSAVACSDPPVAARAVRPGIEVLLADSLHLVAGRRVGLITNHTGVDREGRSDIDLLVEHPEVELVALYAPEHGIRGSAEAGVEVASEVDGPTGLPIHSLYGSTLSPTPAMLEGVDVLLFDMQDVGARYYTYVSTMALAMRAAGEAGIPFVVLDRPNPIRGDAVQGNVLDPTFATFVGMYPVPMRHGMTAGELARLYVGEFGVSVDLTVVPLGGWSRPMTFAETGLPWTPPSPNIPSLESALAYPGTCLFEGTALSVGRGTDRAFQWIGAPWLDGPALAAALNAYELEGVRFEPATFTPTAPGDGKFDGQEVHGVRVVIEASTFDAPRAAVAMLVEARRASGDAWTWQVAHFDRLAGTDALRLGLTAGRDLEELTAAWAGADATFETLRERYLLY